MKEIKLLKDYGLRYKDDIFKISDNGKWFINRGIGFRIRFVKKNIGKLFEVV